MASPPPPTQNDPRYLDGNPLVLQLPLCPLDDLDVNLQYSLVNFWKSEDLYPQLLRLLGSRL